LVSVAALWFVAFDLEAKIICNESKEPFITSDNPVVYYNQYMENCQTISCTALGSRGLQIFFPISPHIMIHLYDARVYQVGSDKSDCCSIYGDAEVRKLNELQWLDAPENVYYSNAISPDSIVSQSRRVLPRRLNDLTRVEEYVDPTDTNRSLLYMRGVDLKIRLRPSFIRVKKSMKNIPLSERDLIRNPYWLVKLDEFRKQVESGKYQEQDFLKFLAGK